MNKFEKLIELVTEGEEAKAEELFHEIVVEKSREIYESLMDSEDRLGGDEADELMNDIAADEHGMREEEDEDGEMEPGMDDMDDMDDMGGEEEGEEAEEEDLEDRVVDLEDQLDALMAEFDAIMGGGEEDMGDMEMGGEEEFGGEEDEMMPMEAEEVDEDADEVTEEDESAELEEAVQLKKVTKGIANSTEEGSVNKKTVNNDNSGAKGAVAKPHQKVGEESGRADPTAENMGYENQDSGDKAFKQQAPKAKTKGEEGSVNKKSISGS